MNVSIAKKRCLPVLLALFLPAIDALSDTPSPAPVIEALSDMPVPVRSRPAPGILESSTPARLAAERSTAWANRNDASVTRGEEGRVLVIYGQSVPKIACAPLRICSIELEAGEVVNKVDSGDSVRWKISPSIVGSGKERTVHVVIKPLEYDLSTNIKIATDRRMYDIDLFSVKGEKFVRRIAFHYPENDARAWEARKAQMEKENALVTAELPPTSVDKLNFSYIVEGKDSAKPLRVFDDGNKTYVQMGPEFRNQDAPVFVLIGQDGKEQLVNYRLKNGFYIIDKVIDKAALLAGVGDDQTRINISRETCKKRGWFGSCAD